VLTEDGEKLQVKARVVSEPAGPGQLQLSPFRSFSFDFAVVVLLSAADYIVARAAKVPRHVVESIVCGLPAARERQGLVRTPGNHGPSRRVGSDCNYPGGTTGRETL
jgi:hypothetical protein